MVSDARACLRFFYFRHVRGWVEEDFDPAPNFGSAWGEAVVKVWEGRASEAYDAWLDAWRRLGGPSVILPAQKRAYGARVPEVARLMLAAYTKQAQQMVARSRVVAAEGFFEVDLPRTTGTGVHRYGGLLDILIDQRGLQAIEVKSTAWATSQGQFVQRWLDGWTTSSPQVTGYLYSIPKALGDQKVQLFLDAALVHMTARRFEMLRLRRKDWQLEAWAHSTARVIEGVEEEFERLEAEDGRGPMLAFPQNDARCTAFNKQCPYYKVCWGHQRPEEVDTPYGLKDEVWDFRTRGKARLGG